MKCIYDLNARKVNKGDQKENGVKAILYDYTTS